MSWDHRTEEGSSYEGFKTALEEVGISFQEVGLNLEFTDLAGNRKVVEQYTSVDDGDCDGVSRTDIAVYLQGQRPCLITTVLDRGFEGYPEVPEEISDFRFCITHRTYIEGAFRDDYGYDDWEEAEALDGIDDDELSDQSVEPET